VVRKGTSNARSREPAFRFALCGVLLGEMGGGDGNADDSISALAGAQLGWLLSGEAAADARVGELGAGRHH
jgi:hypothetical protein